MAKTKEPTVRGEPARPLKKSNGRGSGAGSSSLSSTLTPKERALIEALPSTLAQIFGQAQHSLTTHRKLVNQLHRTFLACCAVQETVGGDEDKIKLTGEKAFRDGVLDMLDRVVACKKGIVQADRVVKLFASYCGFASEHDPEADDADEDETTPTIRFLTRVAKYLLGGFESKNKMVRWRCVQLLAYVAESMAEMDDDLFCELRDKLLIRARDKEAIVRQQAAIALMKFRPVDEEDDADEGEEGSVNDALLDMMIHDPSPEVRRTVVHNLASPPSPAVLPALLTRLRDVDPLTRRTLYRDLIAASRSVGEAPSAMPADPAKAFSLRQRRAVLRGLKDREPGVQKEASWLAAAWIRDGCDGSVEALLDRLEVVKLGSSSGGIDVAEAVVTAWMNQGGDVPPFDEAWWNALTPEKVFLLRVMVQHLQKEADDKALDEVMPVVMALAFRAEKAFNELVDLLQARGDGDGDDTEQEGDAPEARALRAQTSIVSELMQVAMHADYGDEIGRRKMFNLLRTMTGHPLLPMTLIPNVLDALLKLSSNERDFMRVVVELVQELMESAGGDASLAGRQEAEDDNDFDDDESVQDDGEGGVTIKRKKPVKVANVVLDTDKAALHLRVLAIVHALLERALGSIQENTSLFGVVHELIVPAVRSKDAAIREQGLLCLGLCSFLDKRMALDSFPVLAQQSKDAEGEVQVKVLQILFDQFMLYGMSFLEAKNIPSDRVVEFLMEKLDDRPEIQATAAIGFSKLLLSGILTDAEVVRALVLVYFSPETVGNQDLRQCLSYFFPVYCYSAPMNQRRLQSIIIDAVEILNSVYGELDDKDDMLGINHIAVQMVDWTDPSKAVETTTTDPDYEVHLELAVDIVKELYKRKDKSFRKILCQLLSKLNIMDEVEDVKLRGLLMLIDNLEDRQPLTDSVSRNALNRFKMTLKKRFEDRLSPLEEDELRATEGMHAFFQYIEAFDNGSIAGDNASEEDEEEDEDATDEEDEEADYKIKQKAVAKGPKKTPAKGRTSILSRTSGRRPRDSNVSDAATESTIDATPAPRRSGRPRPPSSVHEQVRLREEIDSLIGSESDEDE